MPSHKRKNQAQLNERRLQRAAEKLRSINKDLSKNYVRAARVFDALAEIEPDHVSTYLGTHAGLGIEDV